MNILQRIKKYFNPPCHLLVIADNDINTIIKSLLHLQGHALTIKLKKELITNISHRLKLIEKDEISSYFGINIESY